MKKKVNRKASKIPTFTSNEEEVRFWDTHSVTDFEDETEDVDIVVELAKPRDETLVLRVQKSIKDRIRTGCPKTRDNYFHACPHLANGKASDKVDADAVS